MKMKHSLYLIILFITTPLLLASNANPSRAEPQPLIGAQISVLEADSLKRCTKYFKELKSLGYNSIFLRVFHNRGDRFHQLVKKSTRKLKPEGVYFTTRQVPVIADILTPVCECAHQSGLKIFAWMNTLKADYSHKHKHKVLTYNQRTGRVKVEKNLLDPGNPENINFLEHLFADLATNPIDGILLQDDLMLRHNQGFKRNGSKIEPAPEKIYNFNPKNHTEIESYKPRFKQWRSQQATTLQNLANLIFTTCRRSKPNLICAQNIHYEIFYNPAWGRDWFAWTKNALKTSKANHLMIMTYQERIRKELEFKSDIELTAALNKIFTNAQQWRQMKTNIIFKFSTPPATSSGLTRKKLLKTLHKTIALAHENHYYDLILTPCNNRQQATALLANQTTP